MNNSSHDERSGNRLARLVAAMIVGLIGAITVAAQDQGSEAGANWFHSGIGSVGGVQIDAVGRVLVRDRGVDLWGTNDTFHFVYQPLNGNGQITARILQINSTNEWAKAGVMVRETLGASARNVTLFQSFGRGGGFEWRPATGKETIMGVGNTNAILPYWVRLVRNGDWVGGYRSTDGINWRLVDWERMEGLPALIYIGLAVCNRDDKGAEGSALFDQVSVMAGEPTAKVEPRLGTGDGLRAMFYPNRHLWGEPTASWVDEQVDFDRLALLGKRLQKEEEYGIRWTGELEAQFNEPYTFSVYRDDGVRVWLNEQLIIDSWKGQAPAEVESAPIQLVAGQRYLLRLEFFQNHGWARVGLRWSSPSTPMHVIPKSQLYSRTIDADRDGLPDLWELHYFGDLSMSPDVDQDGDGVANRGEYLQGSDPTSPLKQGLPNAWTQGDIEDVGGSAGRSGFQDGVFRLTTTYTNGTEHVHYVYQPLGTNAEMVVRLSGLKGNGVDGAGIMVRESLDSQARNVIMTMRTNGLRFPVRDTIGGKILQNDRGMSLPSTNWLKVVRHNDWVGSYTSEDGSRWSLFNWENFPALAPQAFIGMAIVSANPSRNPLIQTEATFDRVTLGAAKDEDVLTPAIGNGDGLTASFRNDSLVYLPGITNRVDPVENFYYVHGAPFPFLNPDSYSVRWTGEVQAQFNEAYEFSLQCRRENWVRVWLNEELIIDGWRKWHQDFKDYSKPIQLVAGQRYLLRVEMYNDHGQAISILRWRSPSTPEHQVPQSQLYSQPEMNASGNGLPVIWEQLYFGKTGVDAGADPDNDGLSNLREYQYHTHPLKADTERDGIPDAWEVAKGLDPQFNDAGLDYDNSGWSNLQKYQHGLDPTNPDTDANGLPDVFEVMYLGSLGNSQARKTQVALGVNGAEAINYLGRWQVDDTDIFCLDRRGAVEFTLKLEKADRYVLNLTGSQSGLNSFVTRMKLFLSVDGQDLGQYILESNAGSNGVVTLVLPYLKTGNHTLKLFWDGAASFSSLRIRRVELLAVDGKDENQNGIKDWADLMTADQSGIDATNLVITSYTSPLCLEGRDGYPVFLRMIKDSTNVLTPIATTDGRWYVNVPLHSTETTVQASYQNEALVETRQLQWQRINLLASPDSQTLRKGDSLWLTILPEGATNGQARITYGTNVLSAPAARGIVCQFPTAGEFAVAGTFTSPAGTTQSGSLTVTVVEQSLPDSNIAAWTGMERNLDLPRFAPEVLLQADSRLSCYVNGTNTTGGARLAIGVDANAERTILTRLGSAGPIFNSTRVSGFDQWSASQTYTRQLQIYEDGSQLIETLLVSSPVQPDVVFVLEPIVSGVIFEDGTITKTLRASDFDALGQCAVRFVRPASAQTSVCHSIRSYQGKYLIGYKH